MAGESTERQTVKTYLDAAHEALAGGQFNLDGGYYAIAVNRANYAVFYAAKALLATEGLARVAAARKSLREEKGIRLEDLPR